MLDIMIEKMKKKSIKFTKRYDEWHKGMRYNVDFGASNMWDCTQDFIDKVLESKTSLLFALKNGDSIRNPLMKFAKDILGRMGPPYNEKFEDIRADWIKAKGN